MKKCILIFILFLSVPLMAQLSYGVKAGLTSSNQTWEFTPRFAKTGETTARSSINLGLFAEYSDDKYVSVLAELNYRQKGANIKMEYTGRDTSGTIIVPKDLEHKLAYMNVSLLGKVRYQVGIFSPYLLAGLKTDYQISNKLDDIDLGHIAEDATKQIWGAVIGAGFEIKNFLPVGILAEVRYEFDFNKLYVEDNFQFKSDTIEFRIGIKF